MKSKYEHEHFAVFQGNLFSSDTWKGYIELHTKSKRIAKKYDFIEENGAFHKLVSPYELTEYYLQSFEAKYQGKTVYIWRGNDKNVDIEAGTGFSPDSLGFVQVEKYVFEKTVRTSELTDIHAKKEDLLEEAKKIFDEFRKKESDALK